MRNDDANRLVGSRVEIYATGGRLMIGVVEDVRSGTIEIDGGREVRVDDVSRWKVLDGPSGL